MQWNGQFGTYFGSGNFTKVSDPQCTQVASSIRNLCTLQAVVDTRTSQIVLQNPTPGNRGTVGRQTVRLPGQWSFDAATSKSVQISESKSLHIRFDGTNILNHPGLTSPSLDVNSTTSAFGAIKAKDNSTLQFRAQLRLNF